MSFIENDNFGFATINKLKSSILSNEFSILIISKWYFFSKKDLILLISKLSSSSWPVINPIFLLTDWERKNKLETISNSKFSIDWFIISDGEKFLFPVNNKIDSSLSPLVIKMPGNIRLIILPFSVLYTKSVGLMLFDISLSIYRFFSWSLKFYKSTNW